MHGDSADQAHPHRGLTLVELLAVLVVLGVCSSVLIARAIGPSPTQRTHRVLEEWMQLDQLARVQSRRSEHDGVLRDIELLMSPDGSRIVLREWRGESASIIVSTTVPRDTTVELLIDNKRTRSVHFGAGGASPDYRIKLVAESSSVTALVCGTTGWVGLEEKL